MLQSLSGTSEAKLMDLCLRSEFTLEACTKGKDVMAGHAMSPSMLQPVCSALLSASKDMSLVESIGALRQRSSQSQQSSLATLDKVLEGKGGLPRPDDYL